MGQSCLRSWAKPSSAKLLSLSALGGNHESGSQNGAASSALIASSDIPWSMRMCFMQKWVCQAKI
jgi:hypothetical protein